jgi:hypothetical protein
MNDSNHAQRERDKILVSSSEFLELEIKKKGSTFPHEG